MSQSDLNKVLNFVNNKKNKAFYYEIFKDSGANMGYLDGFINALGFVQSFIWELELEAEKNDGKKKETSKKKISLDPKQLFSSDFDARDYLSVGVHDEILEKWCAEYGINTGAVDDLVNNFRMYLNVYELPEKVELLVDIEDD